MFIPWEEQKPPEPVPLVHIDGKWRVDCVAIEHEQNLKRAKTWVENYCKMLDMYHGHTGTLPTTEQGLNALVEKPKIPPVPKIWDQITNEIELDPWGRPYRYEHPAKRNKGGMFDVFSLGPDGQSHTADDIGNWGL